MKTSEILIRAKETAQLIRGIDDEIINRALTYMAEELILANDGAIDFYVNCQNGLSSAKKVTLSTAGLLSGHQKAITYGTAAPSGGANGDIYIQY